MALNMKIAYNSKAEVDSRSSSEIREVWFTKSADSGAWGSSDKLCYSIQPTNLGIFPQFPYLMEYNRYDPEDIKYYDNSYPDSNTGYRPKYTIGESLILSELGISKFIFPQKLISEGYTCAFIFQQIPDEQESWYSTPDHLDPATIDSMTNWFYNKWKYKVRLYEDPTNASDVLNELDSIIQFSSAALNNADTLSEDLLRAVHESNYSNPHAQQISYLSNTLVGGNLISEDSFNVLTTTPNSFVLGNQMYNEDFSMRYLGDYLYLTDLEYMDFVVISGFSVPATRPTMGSFYDLSNETTGKMNAVAYPINSKIQNAEFVVTKAVYYNRDDNGPYIRDPDSERGKYHYIDYIDSSTTPGQRYKKSSTDSPDNPQSDDWIDELNWIEELQDYEHTAYNCQELPNEDAWRDMNTKQWGIFQQAIDSRCIIYAPDDNLGTETPPVCIRIAIKDVDNYHFWVHRIPLSNVQLTLRMHNIEQVNYSD